MTGEGRQVRRPLSLPPEALLGSHRQLDPPVRVMAWLYYPDSGWERTDAEATAWTDNAGFIRIGSSIAAWVPASLIQRVSGS